MQLLKAIGRLFGGGSGSDSGLYYYVRCARCKDCVRVRVNQTSELQQEFGESGDGVAGYFVRKVIIDSRCFKPIELELRFNAGRRERSRSIQGGELISAEEFARHEAERGAQGDT